MAIQSYNTLKFLHHQQTFAWTDIWKYYLLDAICLGQAATLWWKILNRFTDIMDFLGKKEKKWISWEKRKKKSKTLNLNLPSLSDAQCQSTLPWSLICGGVAVKQSVLSGWVQQGENQRPHSLKGWGQEQGWIFTLERGGQSVLILQQQQKNAGKSVSLSFTLTSYKKNGCLLQKCYYKVNGRDSSSVAFLIPVP